MARACGFVDVHWHDDDDDDIDDDTTTTRRRHDIDDDDDDTTSTTRHVLMMATTSTRTPLWDVQRYLMPPKEFRLFAQKACRVLLNRRGWVDILVYQSASCV
jgi:hypothetical protein